MIAVPRLLLVRGLSPLRPETSEAEVLATRSAAERDWPYHLLTLDTRAHSDNIESGYWAPVAATTRNLVNAIRADLERHGPATVRFVGIEECPTLIALGAYLGDEHVLESTDYARDDGQFQWPQEQSTFEVETIGLPGERVTTEGLVTLRIELTHLVEDADLDEVVPPGARVADIRIRPARGLPPRPGLVRSLQDVEQVREAIREALAAIEAHRPGAAAIHLFVAGPVSICLAAGRELRLRNNRPAQTYRFRSQNQPKLTPAIRLSAGPEVDVPPPLTAAEREAVRATLVQWREALAEIVAHAETLRASAAAGWPACLTAPLSAVELPQLPGVWTAVDARDRLETTDAFEFRFDLAQRTWYLPEGMLLAMGQASGADALRVRQLARAFLWHEYLHDHQGLTHHTASGVGAFPNCLERIDYIADVYGVLHQVDYLLRRGAAADDAAILRALVDAITDALDSFWTFEPLPPTTWWQQRRLRRYLNWYWRREQTRHAASVAHAIALLATAPVIEIAGPAIGADAPRVFWDLSRVNRPERLELAMVTEDNRLLRLGTRANMSIAGLLEAFRRQDKAQIDEFFAALFEHVRQFR